MNLTQAFEKAKGRIDEVLYHILDFVSPSPTLQVAMDYAVANGGKRLRPFLVYHCAHLLEVEDTPYLDRVAASIELIHCYSLVHDDLPDMDNSPLRRGKASCWKEFNTTTAILVGDALQPLAFEILADIDGGVTPQQQLAIIQLIAQASGSTGMVAGQMMDMFPSELWQEEQLRLLQSLKTGRLIEASCLAPAIIARTRPEQKNLLKKFAENLGLMYQIMDDILDETAEIEKLGKPTGQDQNKRTFVKILGLTTSRDYLHRLHAQNLSLLNQLGSNTHILSLFSQAIAEETVI